MVQIDVRIGDDPWEAQLDELYSQHLYAPVAHADSKRRGYVRSVPLAPESSAKRARRDREDRKAALKEDPTLAPHGSDSTYKNWGCTCVPCAKAHQKAYNEWKEGRKN